jgi:hypothetical protein
VLTRPQIYYFGRLNFIATYQDKKEFLFKGLSTEEPLRIYDFNWGFFDIEDFSDDSEEYFTGYLAKYKPLTEEETADEELHKISLEEARRRITAKSRFFVHVESGLIIYHPVGRMIGRHQFSNNFCKLFEKGHGNFFARAEIQSIDEEYRILDIIKQLQYISRVYFYLHPSNPGPGIWKDVDDRLKKLDTSLYREEYIGKQGKSLKILNDQDFNSKLNMAVDGYGEAEITGNLDGQEKTIRTSDNPVSAKSTHEDEDPQSVFEDLKKVIMYIFNRYIKK